MPLAFAHSLGDQPLYCGLCHGGHMNLPLYERRGIIAQPLGNTMTTPTMSCCANDQRARMACLSAATASPLRHFNYRRLGGPQGCDTLPQPCHGNFTDLLWYFMVLKLDNSQVFCGKLGQ